MGSAVVGERRLNSLLVASIAAKPVVASAGAVEPVVGGGQRPAGPVFGAADAVGGFVSDEFAAGFVADVPHGGVGAGCGVQAAEFGDGRGGLLDLARGVVAAGDHDPGPHPLHPWIVRMFEWSGRG